MSSMIDLPEVRELWAEAAQSTIKSQGVINVPVNLDPDSKRFIPMLDMDLAVGRTAGDFVKDIRIDSDPTIVEEAGKTIQSMRTAWYSTALYDGFVHLDPHPGNMMISSTGKTGTFIDYGKSGYLNDELKVQNYLTAKQKYLNAAPGPAKSMAKRDLKAKKRPRMPACQEREMVS